MFDWIRNLSRSDEERQQARISAYLDDLMPASERQRFEAEMADDPALQQEALQQQAMLQAMRQMPSIKAPRNFTLTPEMVELPQRRAPWYRQPALQGGIALAAIMLVAGIVYMSSQANLSGDTVETVAQNRATSVEVTRLVATTRELMQVEVTRQVEVEGEAVTFGDEMPAEGGALIAESELAFESESDDQASEETASDMAEAADTAADAIIADLPQGTAASELGVASPEDLGAAQAADDLASTDGAHMDGADPPVAAEEAAATSMPDDNSAADPAVVAENTLPSPRQSATSQTDSRAEPPAAPTETLMSPTISPLPAEESPGANWLLIGAAGILLASIVLYYFNKSRGS